MSQASVALTSQPWLAAGIALATVGTVAVAPVVAPMPSHSISGAAHGVELTAFGLIPTAVDQIGAQLENLFAAPDGIDDSGDGFFGALSGAAESLPGLAVGSGSSDVFDQLITGIGSLLGSAGGSGLSELVGQLTDELGSLLTAIGDSGVFTIFDTAVSVLNTINPMTLVANIEADINLTEFVNLVQAFDFDGLLTYFEGIPGQLLDTVTTLFTDLAGDLGFSAGDLAI